MTTLYFNVKQGIQTGNVVIDAASGNVSNVGNITLVSGTSANLGNLVTANYFSGNGSLLTSIPGANVTGYVPNATAANTAGSATTAGTVTTAAQPNITSLGTLTSLTISGNLSANYFTGNGSTLTDITGANVTGYVPLATTANTASTVTTAAQPNITSLGTLSNLTSGGTINFTTASNVSLGDIGNVHITGGAAGYVLQTNGSGVLSFASAGSTGIAGSNTQVQFNDGGSFGASTAFTFDKGTNTLTATNFAGNGAGFTYITGANVNGNVSSAIQSHYANIANSVAGANVSGQVGNALIAGTVYTNAQPNITSTGTLLGLTVTGNLNITGNINATGNLNYQNVTDLVVGDPIIFIGANNTGNLYDLGFVASYDDGTHQHTGFARDATDGVWKLFDDVVAEPTTTVDFANGLYAPLKSGAFVSTGNITAVNASLGNLVVANYFSGDGSLLTNLNSANIGNVGNANFANTAGTVTTNAQPNITSVGTLTSLSVTGNISANYFIGNGATLTSITGANVTGNVNNAVHAYYADVANSVTGANVSGNVADAVHAYYADVANSVAGANVSGQVGNALIAGTVYTNAQPNITSLGNLTSLVVTGNANVGNLLTDGIYYSNGAPYDLVANASGANTTVQFNDNDAFAGSNNFTFNKATDTLSVTNITANGAGITYITGANVNGNVSSAVQSHYANIANSVAGANVSGNVSWAITSNWANVANSVAGANVSGQVGNALIAGTVYTNAQPNITSVGTLTSLDVSGTATIDVVSLTTGITSDRSNVSVTTSTVIDQFVPTTYRTAKYIISASGDDGYQSVETLLVHNGSTAYITIYGSVCSNISADIIELSSNVNGVSGNVTLYATSASANAKVNIVTTYINT
jgi:hypothetical protein